jgi:ABC-type molybdate transport system ATPase subunit
MEIMMIMRKNNNIPIKNLLNQKVEEVVINNKMIMIKIDLVDMERTVATSLSLVRE